MPSALQSPRLRRILVAYTINRLGTWIGLLALLVAVFDHTHSALAVAALMLAGQALPAFIVPAAVARVEASRRRRELSGLYLFEAAVIATLAILLSHFWLPAVLLLVALDGTAALTTNSLLRSEVARAARAHVDAQIAARDAGGRSQLPGSGDAGSIRAASFDEVERKANAALNLAFSATFVAGPVLGGALVAADGAPAALFVDVASFLICGALLLDLHPHVSEAAGESVRARLRTAWRHVNEAPSLRGLLLVEAIAFVFFESGAPIEVSFVKTTLSAGDGGLGLVLTAWGAGAVVGSIIFARTLHRPLRLMLTAGPLGIGLAYLGFAAAPSLGPACAAAFIGGVGNGLQWASLFSAVQRLTPPGLHGRMMGAVESLSSLGMAFGLALGGGLVALSSPRGAFLVVGLGTAAAALALLRVSPSSSAVVMEDAAPDRAGEWVSELVDELPPAEPASHQPAPP